MNRLLFITTKPCCHGNKI